MMRSQSSSTRLILTATSAAIAVALAGLALLASPAQAHLGAAMTFHHAKAKPAKRVHPARALPMLIGMGNVASIGCANLPLAGTSYVRVIAGYQDSPTRMLSCAQAARSAGLRVLLVVQWGNRWSLAQIEQRFRDALRAYCNIRPFAVGIGNEQEGPWNDGPPESGARYAALWRVLEPMVAHAFPHAIRVAGETSPWGDTFMESAAAAGLPGAQAYAFHAYPTSGSGGLAAIHRFVSNAQAHHVQAWADEGMCGPSVWMTFGCSTAAELTRDGFALAGEWYDATPVASQPVSSPSIYGWTPPTGA